MKNARAFKPPVTNTTVTNKAANDSGGKFAISIAEIKKIVPDKIVPNPTSKVETIRFVTKCFNNRTTTKNTIPVINLSMIFGTNPPGNVENKPDNTPVEIDSTNISLNVGNNKIPMNIIKTIKSGFIPPP